MQTVPQILSCVKNTAQNSSNTLFQAKKVHFFWGGDLVGGRGTPSPHATPRPQLSLLDSPLCPAEFQTYLRRWRQGRVMIEEGLFAAKVCLAHTVAMTQAIMRRLHLSTTL